MVSWRTLEPWRHWKVTRPLIVYAGLPVTGISWKLVPPWRAELGGADRDEARVPAVHQVGPGVGRRCPGTAAESACTSCPSRVRRPASSRGRRPCWADRRDCTRRPSPTVRASDSSECPRGGAAGVLGAPSRHRNASTHTRSPTAPVAQDCARGDPTDPIDRTTRAWSPAWPSAEDSAARTGVGRLGSVVAIWPRRGRGVISLRRGRHALSRGRGAAGARAGVLDARARRPGAHRRAGGAARASSRARSCSARAIRATPATSCAPAAPARCASTPTGARSRSPHSAPGTSSASSRCSRTSAARRPWKRSSRRPSWRCWAPTCAA